MIADCSKCRHMYHICSKNTRPDTMFCNALGNTNQYCKTINPRGGCQKFSPVVLNKMALADARQILLKHRPERPRSTEQRQLQAAIDTIMEYFNGYDTEK